MGDNLWKFVLKKLEYFYIITVHLWVNDRVKMPNIVSELYR